MFGTITRNAILPLIMALALSAGCVTTGEPRYASMAEVPEAGLPLYSSLDGYMGCSLSNFRTLNIMVQPQDQVQVELLADRACAGCNLLLEDYRNFVHEKTGDQDFADEQAEDLRDFTRDKLVEAYRSPSE